MLKNLEMDSEKEKLLLEINSKEKQINKLAETIEKQKSKFREFEEKIKMDTSSIVKLSETGNFKLGNVLEMTYLNEIKGCVVNILREKKKLKKNMKYQKKNEDLLTKQISKEKVDTAEKITNLKEFENKKISEIISQYEETIYNLKERFSTRENELLQKLEIKEFEIEKLNIALDEHIDIIKKKENEKGDILKIALYKDNKNIQNFIDFKDNLEEENKVEQYKRTVEFNEQTEKIDKDLANSILFDFSCILLEISNKMTKFCEIKNLLKYFFI